MRENRKRDRKQNEKRSWKRGLAGGLSALLAVSAVQGMTWAEELQEVSGSAMGRYIETELQLPEDTYPCAITAMEDGRLRMLGQVMREEGEDMTGLWDSSDGGESWELAAQFPDAYTDAYFAGADLTWDGSGAAVQMTDVPKEGDLILNFLSFDTEGTVKETKLGSLNNMDAFLAQSLSFNREGQLVTNGFGRTAALLDPQTGAVLTEVCDDAEFAFACGQEAVVLSGSGQLQLYDMETGEPLPQDEALENALFAEGQSYAQISSSGYPIVFTGDAEGRLFYCSQKGIFAHMPGGGTVEQVVDGRLNSLSDPSLLLNDMAVLGQSFYVMYAKGGQTPNGILKYEFDPDMTSTPERALKVYSLTEDRNLRQAVSQFQKQYPDTYVDYQIGMSEEEGVTAADALRTLNTDILAGNGPDVLLLDGISIDAYESKGLLTDLTELLEQVGETDGLLENVAYAYRRESGTYAVPVCFSIPVIAGKAEWREGVTSLSDLPKLGQTHTALWAGNAKLAAALLYPVCAGSWRREDGTINQEGLAEYVSCVKQFYDAWMKEVTPEEQEYLAQTVSWEDAWDVYGEIDMGTMDLAGGTAQAYVGYLSNIMSYCGVSSVNKMNGDCGISVLSGQQTDVFIPRTVLSILSTAQETERAADFAAYLLSPEAAQSGIESRGFPVNRTAFAQALHEPSFEDGEWSASSSNMETGESVELVYNWPTQEELEYLESMADGLSVCADGDYVMRQAVLEHVYRCLDGEIGQEEAVNAIMQTVNLYLAE